MTGEQSPAVTADGKAASTKAKSGKKKQVGIDTYFMTNGTIKGRFCFITQTQYQPVLKVSKSITFFHSTK